jgi:hypothetical protein
MMPAISTSQEPPFTVLDDRDAKPSCWAAVRVLELRREEPLH